MGNSCLNHPVVCGVVRFFRWLPVIFIVAIICWSYYAYVYELCVNTVKNVVEKIFYLLVYHCFLAVFLWSYWQTTFAPLSLVPKRFAIPDEIFKDLVQEPPTRQRYLLEHLAKDLPVLTRSYDGSIRYCEKCRIVKPDRAHHCSVCGQCVLKMDHHCPWVNTCVSFHNYKFFILFLGWAFVYCVFIALSDLQYFIRLWGDGGIGDSGAGKFHVMFLFFVSVMFSISVSTLLFYHLWLVSRNRSTLESFRPPIFTTGPDKEGFSLGVSGNFQEIFGDNRILWFLPLFSSFGDGIQYPVRTLDIESDGLLNGRQRWMENDSETSEAEEDLHMDRIVIR